MNYNKQSLKAILTEIIRDDKYNRQIVEQIMKIQYLCEFILCLLNAIYEIIITSFQAIQEYEEKQKDNLSYQIVIILNHIVLSILSFIVSYKNKQKGSVQFLRFIFIILSFEQSTLKYHITTSSYQFIIFFALTIIQLRYISYEITKIILVIILIILLIFHIVFLNINEQITFPFIITIILSLLIPQGSQKQKNNQDINDLQDKMNDEKVNNFKQIPYQLNNDQEAKYKNISILNINNQSYGALLNPSNVYQQMEFSAIQKMQESNINQEKEIDTPTPQYQQEQQLCNIILSKLKIGIALIGSDSQLVYFNKSMKKAFNIQGDDELLTKMLKFKIKEKQEIESKITQVKKNQSPTENEKKLLKYGTLSSDYFQKNSVQGFGYERQTSQQQSMNSFQSHNFNYSENLNNIQTPQNICKSMQIDVNFQPNTAAEKGVIQNNSNKRPSININSINNNNSNYFTNSININNNNSVKSNGSNMMKDSFYINRDDSISPKRVKNEKTTQSRRESTFKINKKSNYQKSYNKSNSVYEQSTYTKPKKQSVCQSIKEQNCNISHISFHQQKNNLYNMRQCIIPPSILDLFTKDSLKLNDIFQFIFDNQHKIVQYNFWSSNDIKDRMNVNDTLKAQENDSKQNKNFVYYLDNNDLIIRFKEKIETFNFLQLRIGFYTLKQSFENINKITESLIMVEVFNDNKLKNALEQQEVIEYKNRMLASVSHELRTPLNCSIPMLQLLMNRYSENNISLTPQEDEVRELLVKPALLSNQFLLNIINDILDYGQINTGSFKLDFAPFRVVEVISECADMIYFQASLKDITIQLNFADNLPDCIHSDANRVRQVLLNILSNAIKFTNKGSVTVNISAENFELIKLEVKDTGIGISKNQLKNFFETFGNKDASHYLNTYGAGLGLSIANKLALGLGGNRRIEVQSQVNVGTTVIFYVVNRASHKRGAEYKLKDIFSQKYVKWETISKDNNSSAQLILSSKYIINNRIRSQRNSQQIEQSSSIRNEQGFIINNENNSNNSGSIILTNNIQQNIITLTMKPSYHLIEGQKQVSISMRSVSQGQSLLNTSLADYRNNRNNSLRPSRPIGSIEFPNTSENEYKSMQRGKSERRFSDKPFSAILESCLILDESYKENQKTNESPLPNNSHEQYFREQRQIIDEQSPSLKASCEALNEISKKSLDSEQRNIQLVPNLLYSDRRSPKKQKQKIQFFTSSNGSTKSPIDTKSSFNPKKQQEQQSQQNSQGENLNLLQQINSELKCICPKILVVDDNEMNIYALQHLLKQYGFATDKASNGQIGVDKVIEKNRNSECCKKYALIFMDIDMPVKNGHDATKDILNYFKSIKSKPPIISACSAYVQESEKKLAEKNGMSYYITKPIIKSSLEEVLMKVFININ